VAQAAFGAQLAKYACVARVASDGVVQLAVVGAKPRADVEVTCCCCCLLMLLVIGFVLGCDGCRCLLFDEVYDRCQKLDMLVVGR
jgi:hypothetical protein